MSKDKSVEEVNKNLWQIRPCHLYKEEYRDCTSFKARFHQYFIHGKSIDCGQWKLDLDNCVRYEENNDTKSALELIESETVRRQLRLKDHYANNVWEKRKNKPPKDWDKPLPEWMQEQFENTYLSMKAKELQGQNVDLKKFDTGMCVIL